MRVCFTVSLRGVHFASYCLSLGCALWQLLFGLGVCIVAVTVCLWGVQCGSYCFSLGCAVWQLLFFFGVCSVAVTVFLLGCAVWQLPFVFGVCSVAVTVCLWGEQCGSYRLSLGCAVWQLLFFFGVCSVAVTVFLWGVRCGSYCPSRYMYWFILHLVRSLISLCRPTITTGGGVGGWEGNRNVFFSVLEYAVGWKVACMVSLHLKGAVYIV